MGALGAGRADASSATRTQSQSQINAAALQQIEHKGAGGGGGSHGHGAVKKSGLDAIEDLARRASLKIESRAKSVADRMSEIERLKQKQEANRRKIGERNGGAGDEKATDVGGVSGRVIDRQSLQPIADALVSIGNLCVQTDETGAFTIADVPVGIQTLFICAFGWQDATATVVVQTARRVVIPEPFLLLRSP